MALPIAATKCVVFLGYQDGPEGTARIKAFGTGFFLKGGRKVVPGGCYLVTAKHVAEKLDPPFVIRLNKKGGGAGIHEIEKIGEIKWYTHKDSTVDIAVTPFEPPDWADVVPFSADHSLRVFKMESKRIDAGDLTYVVGLFHLLHGKEENLPVVHTGRIAMLPKTERIPVDGQEVEGYLVQANTLSGCSGSPVFAQRTLAVQIPTNMLNEKYHKDTKPLNADIAGSLWLLGVWQSSWKVKGSQIVSVTADVNDTNTELAPLGIGVVVPAIKLLQVLDDPELRARRSGG